MFFGRTPEMQAFLDNKEGEFQRADAGFLLEGIGEQVDRETARHDRKRAKEDRRQRRRERIKGIRDTALVGTAAGVLAVGALELGERRGRTPPEAPSSETPTITLHNVHGRAGATEVIPLEDATPAQKAQHDFEQRGHFPGQS